MLAGCLHRGDLEFEPALQIVEGAEEQTQGHEFSVPSAQVLARAEASRCSAYDCEFVVAAEELAVELVTCDEKLLRSFPRICRSLG